MVTDMRFNPRARTGRDPMRRGDAALRVTFQSTRPHGARHDNTRRPLHRWTCFNPRARTGRDAHSAAPVDDQLRFNPRARTGRDVASCDELIAADCVSIHAPARGATRSVRR